MNDIPKRKKRDSFSFDLALVAKHCPAHVCPNVACGRKHDDTDSLACHLLKRLATCGSVFTSIIQAAEVAVASPAVDEEAHVGVSPASPALSSASSRVASPVKKKVKKKKAKAKPANPTSKAAARGRLFAAAAPAASSGQAEQEGEAVVASSPSITAARPADEPVAALAPVVPETAVASDESVESAQGSRVDMIAEVVPIADVPAEGALPVMSVAEPAPLPNVAPSSSSPQGQGVPQSMDVLPRVIEALVIAPVVPAMQPPPPVFEPAGPVIALPVAAPAAPVMVPAAQPAELAAPLAESSAPPAEPAAPEAQPAASQQRRGPRLTHTPTAPVNAPAAAALSTQRNTGGVGTSSSLVWDWVDKAKLPSPVTRVDRGVATVEYPKAPCPVKHVTGLRAGQVCGKEVSTYQAAGRGMSKKRHHADAWKKHFIRDHPEDWANAVARRNAATVRDTIIGDNRSSVSPGLQAQFEELLAAFITSAGLANATVQNIQFRRMVRLLAKVKVPSANSMRPKIAVLAERIRAVYGRRIKDQVTR